MALPRFARIRKFVPKAKQLFSKAYGGIKQRLLASEKQSERLAQQMEKEVQQEIRDESAVEKQEKQKEKITKGEEKLINNAIKTLKSCRRNLRIGRLKAAIKNVDQALKIIQQIMRSEAIKMRISQIEQTEIARDIRTTQTEEMQAIAEEKATQGRLNTRRRKG